MKLKDVGKIVTGKTPSTKNTNFWNGDIPFITPKDIQLTKKIYSTERYISRTGLNSIKSAILSSNAICVSCIGNIGYVAMTTSECATNQQINSIIVNNDIIPDYIYYVLKSMWRMFKNFEGQSTTLSILNKKDFSNIDVYVPNYEKQRKIVKILSSFDKKIEYNNKINDNLEQQAQLFYVETCVKKINYKWKKGTLSDIGSIVGGSTPSKANPHYYTKNGIPWITPKDLSTNKSKFIYRGENDISELGLNSTSITIMPKGTVLFSSRAPIGYIAIAANEVTTNQGFKSVIPKSNIGTEFIYCFLKNNINIIENMSSGSTFKEISGSNMKKVPVTIPDTETLIRFKKLCLPLFEQQKILERQNFYLSLLRDNLLTKLISGEIDISQLDI